MTVWFDKGRGGWRYSFQLFGRRHTYARSFDNETDATDAEHELRRSLKRQAAGLEAPPKVQSPRFSEIAGAYYQFLIDRDRLTDPVTVDRMHRVILRFFGPRPKASTSKGHVSERTAARLAGAPYHDLRLEDVIAHPSWILKFEQWMTRQKLSGATKNRYRSAASRLYWFAMLPEMREATGVTMNPFRGILRDREQKRDVVISRDELARIMAHAPPHLRLALVIGVLAPKLRMGNILALRWDRHFDRELSTIRIREHKTAGKTGRALVAPISATLRSILQAAKDRQPKRVPWVIHYRKRPTKRIHDMMRSACEAAGVDYGRAKDGPTFHTLRHTAATLLAAIGVPEGLRKDVMGHLSIQTTQGYTHLQPVHELAPLEQLSAQLPALEASMAAPRLTAPARRPGKTARHKR